MSHDVVEYEVSTKGVAALAVQPAGSHIYVEADDRQVRQYSVLPGEAGSLRFAVKLSGSDTQDRIRRRLIPGEMAKISAPVLVVSLEASQNYLFLAGGIGITPVLALLTELVFSRASAAWSLHYIVSTANDLVFLEELLSLARRSNGKVHTVVTSATGRPDIASIFEGMSIDTRVYASGPVGLLEVIRKSAIVHDLESRLRIELPSVTAAGGASSDLSTVGRCRVELKRSDMSLIVNRDQPLLGPLLQAGVKVPTSCRRGICGTCELTVLAGEVDHRDQVLSAEERAAGESMLPCVSAPLGDRLELDL